MDDHIARICTKVAGGGCVIACLTDPGIRNINAELSLGDKSLEAVRTVLQMAQTICAAGRNRLDQDDGNAT